ncbi:hypothetical protein B0H13DRAFT_2288363 [Mycena leptocephala]|nr:hypothetical protein B0H13DRAFT_2288363 [Mycena leptocephala]
MRWLKTVNGSRNNISKQLFSFPPISFLAIVPPFCPLTSFPPPILSMVSSIPRDIWEAFTIPHRILLLSAPHHPVYHDEHRPHGSNLSLGGLSVGARQSRVVLIKFLSQHLNSFSRGPGLCDTSVVSSMIKHNMRWTKDVLNAGRVTILL